MHLMPLYAGNARRLHRFILDRYVDASSGGVFANTSGRHIGLFGVLKLAEAELYAYRATGEQAYLDGLRARLEFCLAHRRTNGINNFWTADLGSDSNWIESNHSGIFAHCAAEYWELTGDDRFTESAIALMEAIPAGDRSDGAFVDGYDNAATTIDDRQYVADNTEIMLGWWACYRITGEERHRAAALRVLAFLDANFRSVPSQPDARAWLVGPLHVPYGEGSAGFCDAGHTTYEQFFAARNLLLMDLDDHSWQIPVAADWVNAYSRFDDGFVGYNECDDKMVGWSAYYAAHSYWAYRISGDVDHLVRAHQAVHAVLGVQDEATGAVTAFLPISGAINVDELDAAAEGLGAIWQLAAALQGLTMPTVVPDSPVRVIKQTAGSSVVTRAELLDDARVQIELALTGSGAAETLVVRGATVDGSISLDAPSGSDARAMVGPDGAVEITYTDTHGDVRVDLALA